MLGTDAVKQYFSTGKSHYIVPQVALEWNYNLFYAPYATVNGDGTQVAATGSWDHAPSTFAGGRATSVFNLDSNQTTRTCMAFSSTIGSGNATLTLNSLSNTTNTYKVTFWAKTDVDANVSLSVLAEIDYHRSHSASKTIDNINWTKFEVYLSSLPTGTPYSNPTISFYYSSLDTTTQYKVLIDQLEIHQTTDFEYRYGNLWKTSAPFDAFRPGESYVPSGNALAQHPNGFRKIKYDFQSSTGAWNGQQMPVSRVVYHPTLLGNDNFNPVYKHGSLSEWTQYKYFVSDTTTQSITGIYDQILNVNKIVIKFNLSYSVPATFTVNLAGGTSTYSGGYSSLYTKSISLSNADIDDSGTCIIYLQTDGSWKSGAQSGYWSTTPQFDFNGNIKFGGTTGGTTDAIVAINKITVTQTSATANSTSAEFKRMQVVEISPRLEIDVNYYTMNVAITAELDNKQNPLPISAISSNMATITLSNVPLTVSNQVVSLFSNNSTSSPLRGLFRNYVKCYINYKINDAISGASASDYIIPGGIFYVDTWDVKDIEKTVVTAYDITKRMQLMTPTDYVAQTEDVFRLLTNVMDFAGFTDYNYDELKRVCKSTTKLTDGTVQTTTAPLKIRYFYVDGTQQKLFDVLREIFEVYQIAAYVDAYGVLRFINIDGIFDSNKTYDMLLHDSSTPISVTTADGYTNSMTVTSNIVQDTYTETTKTKVGKATLTYKTPQIVKTIASDPRLLNNSNFAPNFTATYQDSRNAIWDSTIDDVVTFNHLDNSFMKNENKFKIVDYEANGDTSNGNFNTYPIDHDGYAIIEGEIVDFKYKEWSFVVNGVPYVRSVLNSAEWASIFAEISGMAGANGNIMPSLTGYITNVNRGLFNTPIRDHIVMQTLSDIQNKFVTDNADGVNINTSTGNINLIAHASNISKITTQDPYANNNDYNTFSTQIYMGPSSNISCPVGTSFGLVLHNDQNTPSVYVGITAAIDKTGKYTYTLNVTSDGANATLLSSTNSSSSSSSVSKDITNIINQEALKYPKGSPFQDYGRYINLKFVKVSGGTNAFEIYINKTNLNISTKTNLNLNTKGSYGVYVKGSPSAPSSVEFSEIYATQTAILDPSKYYHYQLPWFAEKLSSNKKIFEVSYMAQSAPKIIGIAYYDIRDAQAPSLDAYPLPLIYNWYYVTKPLTAAPQSTTTAAQYALPHITVGSDALSFSPIYHSGFKSRFAIVNCSPGQVWTRKSPDTINKINVDFSLITDSLITLGNDVVIERVFDEANITETVDITSSWVQDKDTATGILRSIYKALDGFTRDTTISIYGNPLFEIGDIVVINYDLKNIVGQKYFVQGIQQTFDSGLTTILTLNEIGFIPGTATYKASGNTISSTSTQQSVPTPSGYLTPTSTGSGADNTLSAPSNVYLYTNPNPALTNATNHSLYMVTSPSVSTVTVTIDNGQAYLHPATTNSANNYISLASLSSGVHTVKLQSVNGQGVPGAYGIYTITI